MRASGEASGVPSVSVLPSGSDRSSSKFTSGSFAYNARTDAGSRDRYPPTMRPSVNGLVVEDCISFNRAAAAESVANPQRQLAHGAGFRPIAQRLIELRAPTSLVTGNGAGRDSDDKTHRECRERSDRRPMATAASARRPRQPAAPVASETTTIARPGILALFTIGMYRRNAPGKNHARIPAEHPQMRAQRPDEKDQADRRSTAGRSGRAR